MSANADARIFATLEPPWPALAEIKLLPMSGTHGPADGIPFHQEPFKSEELKQKMRQLVEGITH